MNNHKKTRFRRNFKNSYMFDKRRKKREKRKDRKKRKDRMKKEGLVKKWRLLQKFRNNLPQMFVDIFCRCIVPFLSFIEQKQCVTVSSKIYKDLSINPICEIILKNGNKYYGHVNPKTKKQCGQGIEYCYPVYNSFSYPCLYFYYGRNNRQLRTAYVNNLDTYEGHWEEGKHTGQGMIKKSDSIYKGQVKNKMAHGYGKWEYSNGEIVEGEFENGVKHGKIVTITDTCDRIEQTYIHGKSFGKEKYIYSCGHVFVGILDGTGMMKYKNGDLYVGQWTNYSIYRLSSGKMIYANGDVYQGKWKFDIGISLPGKSKNAKWRRMKRHGMGTYTYKKSGNMHIGKWKDGKQHGKGKLVRSDKTIIHERIWYEGKLRVSK